jgi:hypothetical protein
MDDETATAAAADISLLSYLRSHPVNLPEETVHVPEWGRDVVLRGLSSRERDLFEEENLRRAQAKTGNGATKRKGATPDLEADLTNFRARLVALHIVEGGARILANKKGEDLLGEQSGAVLDRLFNIARRLSGFTTEDIDELVGNSNATGADDSSSSSRAH